MEELKEKYRKAIVKNVTELEEDKTLALAKKALKAGIPMNAIAQFLEEGMDNVGRLFEENEYYIGDLIMAGIIFKEVMKLDDSRNDADVSEYGSKGLILIGTVNGDIHDIGKDIFVGMACVNGFNVVDLGVNVPGDVFIEKIKEIKPDILGFSGLITQAGREVRDLLKRINNEGLHDGIKIIVGGGLMRKEDETEEIFADAYVKNSARGIEICNKWAEEGFR